MIPYLTSSLLSKLPHIRHGFTTRNGGVSEGLYESLNVSFLSGDRPEHIQENRQRICQTFHAKTVLIANQIHSNKVLFADEIGTATPGDAIIATTPGTLIGVMSADCPPLLIADKEGQAVAAVHAGWRGATSGVIQNTIDTLVKMGCRRSNLFVAIGPCIWQETYEVDQNFYNNLPNSKTFFIPSVKQNHWMFDLPGYIENLLKENGINNFSPSPINTYTNPDQFFSCRRATHKQESAFGCSLAVIKLEEPSL